MPINIIVNINGGFCNNKNAYIIQTRSEFFASFCRRATKSHPLGWLVCIIRHLASFPQSSIIAATRLDFCVRDENRYFPGAMDTEKRH